MRVTITIEADAASSAVLQKLLAAAAPGATVTTTAPAAAEPALAKSAGRGKKANAAATPAPAAEEPAGEGDGSDAQGADPFGLNEEEAEETPEYSFADLKGAAAKFMEAKGAPALEKVITSFKDSKGQPAMKLSAVQENDYPAFMKKVAA